MAHNVPQPHRSIVAGRHQPPTVRVERHVGHAVGVAGERRTDPALGGDVPQSYPVVAASGRDRAAIRAERQAVDVVEVGRRDTERVAELAVRRQVPEPDCVVRAAGCEGSAVMADCQGGDDTRMAPERLPDLPMARRVPPPYVGVSGGRGEQLPVGAENDAVTRIGARNWPALLVRVGNREDRAAGGGRRRDSIRLEREQACQSEVGGATGLLGEQPGLRLVRGVDGALALNERQNGQDHGDGQTRGKRADDGVQPAGRRLAAARDELALLAGRRRLVPVLAAQPGLGLTEVGAPEQVAAVALCVGPLADATGQPGVLVAPLQIGFERIHQAINPGRHLVLITQKHPFGLSDRRGQRALWRIPVDNRNDQLVQRHRILDLIEALR